MLAKHAEMDEDVAVELVADQEAEAAGGVEPLHLARDTAGRSPGCASASAPVRARVVDALLTRHRQRSLTPVRCVGLNRLQSPPTTAFRPALRDRRLLPGSSATIARARSNEWPARIIAAIARSRCVALGLFVRERPDPAPLGEAERRRRLARCRQARALRCRPPRRHRRRAGFAAPAARRSRGRSATATSAPRKRRRRHSRAEPAARRPARNRGSRLAAPAALAQLARQIGAKLGPGRREAPDIAQRQLVERRRRRAAGAVFGGYWAAMRRFCATVAAHHKAARGLAAAHGRPVQRTMRNCGVLDRKSTIAADLAPPGANSDDRRSAAPHRRFRHARRGARLCRQGPPRPQFPRCARERWSALTPIRSFATTRLLNARRFIALGLKPGDRLALIAETGARVRRRLLRRGLRRPVAGAAAAADQLRRPRRLCRAAQGDARQQRPGAVPLSRTSSRLMPARPPRSSASRAAAGKRSTSSKRPAASFRAPAGDDIAYLQYSSGSTRFPHGVAVTHRGAARQSARARRRPGDRGDRPRRFLAALVPRHGPGRLPAVADRQPDCRSII